MQKIAVILALLSLLILFVLGFSLYKKSDGSTYSMSNSMPLLQSRSQSQSGGSYHTSSNDFDLVRNESMNQALKNIIGPAVFDSATNKIFIGPDTNCIQKPTCKDPPDIATSLMYTSSLPRSSVGPGKATDSYYSSRTTPNPFKPPCLTGQPYGNSMATYNYFKLLPKLLQLQYTDCDKYGCSSESANGYTALPSMDSIPGFNTSLASAGFAAGLGAPTLACDNVNQQYYNSSEDFCRDHPTDYPCPNWWMNNSPQIRDVTRIPGYKCLAHMVTTYNKQSKKSIEQEKALRARAPGFCLETDPNCKLDDGPSILAIHSGREDQGLC